MARSIKMKPLGYYDGLDLKDVYIKRKGGSGDNDSVNEIGYDFIAEVFRRQLDKISSRERAYIVRRIKTEFLNPMDNSARLLRQLYNELQI